MVTRTGTFGSRRELATIVRMGAALALLGCDGSVPLVSSDPAPALYFLVSDGPGAERSPDVFGLVATSALVRDARYLSIASVTARRVADGRTLALDIVPKDGPLIGFSLGVAPTFRMEDGNLRWRQIGDGSRLGLQDVAAGDSIELVVETPVARLHGAFRMPARQLPVVRIDVQVGVGGALVRDTMLDIDATISAFFLESADSVSVVAYDRNSADYLGLPSRDAAGVRGGFGVVGAVVRGSTVPLPPKPSP
ncbi:MAG: hypothetical protein MUF00_20020 [Gemmatimonadaceae bacterium]|nr:hypothetical protein [Gemmatimonadaceae bacterium]